MRAGRAIVDERRIEAAWKTLCACGHPMPEHHEYRPTYEVVGDTIVETPHPKFKPGLFSCRLCDCEVRG